MIITKHLMNELISLPALKVKNNESYIRVLLSGAGADQTFALCETVFTKFTRMLPALPPVAWGYSPDAYDPASKVREKEVPCWGGILKGSHFNCDPNFVRGRRHMYALTRNDPLRCPPVSVGCDV